MWKPLKKGESLQCQGKKYNQLGTEQQGRKLRLLYSKGTMCLVVLQKLWTGSDRDKTTG